MAFDAGGMEYSIAVADQFSAATTLFRSELDASRLAWLEFKKQIESATTSTKALKRELSSTTGETSKSTAASRARAKASQEEAAATSELTDAQQNLQRILARRRLEAETDLEAQRQNVLLTKRNIGNLSAQADAEAKVAREKHKANVEELARQLQSGKSTTLTKQEIAQLEGKAEALKAIAAFEKKREKILELQRQGRDPQARPLALQKPAALIAAEQAEAIAKRAEVIEERNQILAKKGRDAQGQKIKAFNAEAEALAKFDAIVQQAAVNQALQVRLDLAQIDSSGKKIVEFNAQAAAATIAAEAQKKLAISQALAAKGLDVKGDPFKSFKEVASDQFLAKMQRLETLVELKKLEKGSKRFRDLSKEVGEVDKKASGAFASFKRLFAAFAAFTAIRLALRTFRELIAEAIKFNSVLETANLSIAALLTAVADVRDPLGRAVDASERLALAQKEARRQTALLRLDALKTAATFEDLLETFQVAVAPGFTAGLNIDEIRKLTVAISQAAAAIGLPQNQLAEEIRSLLSGTIQLRTTRIAAALGITNEDIKRAKELGTLAQFLQKRFEAFSASGEVATRNFNVILSNLKNAFQQLLGAGTLDFFENLKGLLTEIKDALVQADLDHLQVNPKAVEVVKSIAGGLSAAVDEARRLIVALSFGDIVAASQLLGDTLASAIRVLGALLEGVVAGIRTVVSLANAVVSVFTSAKSALSDILPERGFLRALTLITQIATVYGVIFGLSKAWALVTKGLIIPLTAINVLASNFTTSLQKTNSVAQALRATLISTESVLAGISTILTAGSILLIFKLMDEIRAALELPADVSLTLSAAIESTFAAMVADVAVSINLIKVQLSSLEQRAKEFGANIAESFGIISKAQADSIKTNAMNTFIQDATDAGVDNLKVIDETKAHLEKIRQELVDGNKALDEQRKIVVKLSDLFETLPAVIGGSREGLNDLTNLMRDLKTELEESKQALGQSLDNLGVEGTILSQLQTVEEARIRIRREDLQLRTELSQATQRLRVIEDARTRNETKHLQLQKSERSVVDQGVEVVKRQLELQRRITEESRHAGDLEVEIEAAQRRGDKSEASRLSQKKAASEQTIVALRKELGIQGEIADKLFEGLDPDIASRIKQIISDTISLLGQELVANEQILAIKADIAKLEGEILDIARARVEEQAAKEIRELGLKNRELAVQIVAEERIRDLRRSILELVTDRPLREQVVITQNLVDAERQRLEVLKEQNKINLEGLNKLIQQDLSLSGNTEVDTNIVRLLEQRRLLEEKIRLEEGQQTANLREAQRVLDEINKNLEDPTSFGFSVAIAQFVRDAPDQFQSALSVMQSALEGFTQTAAQSLVSIFSGQAEDIPAAWGQLLARLAEQIFESQIQQVLASIFTKAAAAPVAAQAASVAGGIGVPAPAIAAAAALDPVALTLATASTGLITAAGLWAPVAVTLQTAAASLSGVLLAAGAAHGGKTMANGSVASAAHFTSSARGMARGGRPRGLDPRDRIPIWSRVGEWHIVPESARMYGDRVMSMINQGLIDPLALKALAGPGAAAKSISSPRAPGFATGGKTPNRFAERSRRDEPAVIAAMIPKDEQSQERLVAGGMRARLNEMRVNRNQFRAALGL